MTALDPASVLDTGGLAGRVGLEMVAGQLAPLITVLQAEQARRKADIAITRPAWKNLVFTGGPGTGKSRAAATIAGLYRDLGVLRYGNLIEIPAADLPGPTARDTAAQVTEAVKVTGDLVMITGAHAWHDLPDQGQHLLRCVYQLLTEARKFHGDELAVILAGQVGPLRDMLHAAPALSARFPAVIDFPGYTPAQLTAILRSLAAEAGLTLTPGATPQSRRRPGRRRERPRHRQRPPRRPAAHPGHHQPGAPRHPQSASPATRPPSLLSARPTSLNACQSPPHRHVISTRASTSNRRAGRGGARRKHQPPGRYV